MKIASFNVNGIKARIERLTEWLGEADVDIALLQEIKSTDETFPRQHFEDLGYSVETHGQKGFNGVAILSKFPLEEVSRGLPGDPDDEQARWIEATVVGTVPVRLCNLYLPNGNPAPGSKYDYKLNWMARMKAHAKTLLKTEEAVIMAGDYNIIPTSQDARHPDKWREDALFLPDSRAAYRRILNLGFTEAFRTLNQAPLNYTFWDFQRGAWNRNDGIRIDHFLLSPQAADLLADCQIDQEIRGRDRPSDHVPIWVELAA